MLFHLSSLLFVFLLFSIPARAETLEELDAIVARAPNLDAFLADDKLVREYYEKLRDYYGGEERFKLGDFYWTIKQLKEVKEKVPGFKERLWETTGLGEPFSFSSSAKTYGVTLAADKWTAYHGGLVKKWAETAKPLLEKPDGARLVAERLKRLDEEVAALGPTARENREFFERARKNPEYVEAAAFLLHQKFKSEALNDKLGSGDADLVIDTMNGLRGGLRAEFEKDGIKLGALTTFLQSELPSTKDLLEQKEIFPIEKRTTKTGREVVVGSGAKVTYHFKAIPRRLHGIFKGIPLKECVGGGDFQNLTPERWATIALTGSRLYHVEKAVEGGEPSYLGFVQHVPLRNDKGEIFASTDFGVPQLRAKMIGEAGEVTTLYDQWLKEMHPRMPKEWKGLAVGRSNHINNAGVLHTVRESPSYVFGDTIGRADRFRHLDGMAAAIAKVAAPVNYGYHGNMIFDGQDARAGELVALAPDGIERMRNENFLRGILTGDDMSAKQRLVEVLGSVGALPAETAALVKANLHVEAVRAWGEQNQRLAMYDTPRSKGSLHRPNDKIDQFMQKALAYAGGTGATLGVLSWALPLFIPALADAWPIKIGQTMSYTVGVPMLLPILIKSWLTKPMRYLAELRRARAADEERYFRLGQPWYYPARLRGVVNHCRAGLAAMVGK